MNVDFSSAAVSMPERTKYLLPNLTLQIPLKQLKTLIAKHSAIINNFDDNFGHAASTTPTIKVLFAR